VKKVQETQVKIRVVDPPTIPFRSLGVSKLILALAAILFAFALSVGLVLLSHMVAMSMLHMRASRVTREDDVSKEQDKVVSATRSARAI
jgi:hypothetical protein